MTTSIRKVRGLGASGGGTDHHIHQRVSAIGLLFLVPWFIYSIIHAFNAGYDGSIAWVSQPLNAILLVVTLCAALYHMRLGMQAVIEDYIGKTGMKQTLLIASTFATFGLFAAAIVSVLKIWIVAGA